MAQKHTPDSDDARVAYEKVGEVRERVATLEAQSEAMRSEIADIDEKQDEVLDRLRNLDSKGMAEDEFAEKVEKNTRLRHLLKWAGGIGLTLVASTSIAEWVHLL